MNRANYMIAGIGLIACIAMSLLMKHVLEVKKEGDTPRVVVELMNLYGQRFAEPASFRFERRGEDLIGHLVIYPLLSANRARLVRSCGEFVWRNALRATEMDVLVVEANDGLGREDRFTVPNPTQVGRSMQRLQPGADPMAKRGPKARKSAAARVKSASAVAPTAASKPSQAGASSRPSAKQPATPPKPGR